MGKDLQSEKGAGESLIMRAHRLVAQREAKRILDNCRKEKRMVTDEEITTILRYWGFARNVARFNVMRKGVKWVWSDTIGLLRDRQGDIHLTKSTKAYPEVVHVLSKWLSDRLPATEAKDFKWTSINVNKDYAGKIHRDGNNFGPSMITAFGEFSGGKLRYYGKHDNGKVDLEELEKTAANKADKLDLKNGLALFNGNSAHSVEEFQGNRFSVVFFTLGSHCSMKSEDRQKLEKLGMATPTPDDSPYTIISAPVGERSNRRYQQDAQSQKLPTCRYWDKNSLATSRKRKSQ